MLFEKNFALIIQITNVKFHSNFKYLDITRPIINSYKNHNHTDNIKLKSLYEALFYLNYFNHQSLN